MIPLLIPFGAITVNGAPGAVVPIPTLPVLVLLISPFPFVVHWGYAVEALPSMQPIITTNIDQEMLRLRLKDERSLAVLDSVLFEDSEILNITSSFPAQLAWRLPRCGPLNVSTKRKRALITVNYLMGYESIPRKSIEREE